MTTLRAPRPRFVGVGSAALAALCLSLPALAASCAGSSEVDSDGDDAAQGDGDALSTADAISRAEEWVSAKLHYCQSANHARDFDSACSSVCERTSNKSWDPYRSDCSGLVSWAWGLPAPGRTTLGFAPFETDLTHAISASSLEPGDAVNNSEHVMLFKRWVDKDHRAEFIEEPGCSSSTPYAHEVTSDVSISGSSIHVSYNAMTFTAIRYSHLSSGGGGGSSPPPAPSMSADRIGVSTYGPGRLDLFARDDEDRLQHSYYQDSHWSTWANLGGDLASSPAAVSWAPGRIDVFAQGKNGHLVHTYWDGKWEAFEDLGGNLSSAPTVVSQGERSLDVFARDDGNRLVHIYFRDATRWSAWENLGGELASTPAAAVWAPGRIDVFARETNDNLAHIYFDSDPHKWSAWEDMEGPIKSGPVVTSWGEGRLDVFGGGEKDELRHRWYTNGAWSNWESLGGTMASSPTGVSWGAGRIDVFARGGNDVLVHKYFDASGWSSWVHENHLPK